MFCFNGIKKIAVIIFCIFSMIAVSCKMPNNHSSDEQDVPSPDNKTYVGFNNPTDFNVKVYVDTPPKSDTDSSFADVRPKGYSEFEISPSAPGSNGSTFYFEYLIPIGTVTIPYYDYTNIRIKEIKDQMVNKLDIPALTNNATTSKFLVIENASNMDIWVQDGSTPLLPYGQPNREILAGENGVFVLPQNTTILSNYTVGGVNNRKNIPTTTVQPGIIYVFKYDVNSVSLYSENHFNFNDRKKIWSIPTSTSPGQYLLMGKQKLRRNPNDGIVIVGTLKYNINSFENSSAYFALLDQYGEVTRERAFSLQGSPSVRLDEVHERQNGNFLISYFAEFNVDTDDYYSKTYLMCITPDGTTRWQLDFSESLSPDFDPDNCKLRIRYIVEKDNKTFAIGAEFWDGDYSASFVTEVKENVAGNGASFSWPQHYISDFADYRYCTGLVYNSALDAYITVDLFNENGQLEGIYRVFKATDGSIIKKNAAREYERFNFVGMSQVGDKYYIFGEYLDINGEYSASILRFNADMTLDINFDPILIHTDDGDAYFWSCDSDDKKVVFAGTIAVSGKDEVPWTYAIDRNTGVKLWENIYDDLDYNIVWNVEINSIGTLQLELYDWDTESSLIASTDLFGRISSERKAPIPRNPSLTITTPSVTVTYDINGGTGATPVPTVTTENSVTLAGGSGFSRSGYTFGGWNTNASGTGTNYSAGSSIQASNITLYAKWDVVTYSVIFNINSGTGTAPSARTENHGSNITLPSGSGLSRNGYTFGGWNTNASGTGTNYSADSLYTVTGNITLYAKWNAVIYTVTYNINSGTGTTPTAQNATAGNSVTLVGNSGFSRSGYTFGGWNTNTSGTGTNYSAGSLYNVTGNITLYAKWDVTYTVTFNANGATSGTAPASQKAGSGSNITLPAGSGLSRTNYTFGGWNTNTSGTGTNYSADSLYTVTGNITLYAKWDDASTVWTVMFATNGGSPVGDATILKNTAVSRPSPDPAKTGYTFDGWYTNTGLTAPYNFSSIVTSDITLYAKSNARTYTVSYNANGGTGTTANSSHTYDVDRNLTANGFTYTGYTFAGWARTTTGAVEFTNSQSVKNLTATAGSTITLYAKWNPITYTVTYNINNGSGTTPSVQTANYGSNITLPSGSGFSRTSYNFGGWNTNTSGTGTNYNANSAYTVTGNITLYAKWNAVYTVTFDANGATSGTAPAPQTIGSGSYITLPSGSGLSRTSYNFGGWNTNTSGTGTNYNDGSAFNVTGNVTLYAKWNPITVVPGSTLAAKLSWLQTYALSNVDYTVEVSANESISPTMLSYSNRSNIGITLRGTGAVRTVSISSNGAMFTVESGVTLTLDNNITLQGRSSNTDSIIVVNGKLVMNTGSLVSGNTSSIYGGGVYVATSGTFTMNGGTVSGNTVSVSNKSACGGGVCVDGTFTMSGGTISGNTTSAGIGSGIVSYGGGVYVFGSFTMSGGTISGNAATFPSSNFRGTAYGGGVFVDSGTFTKTGGTIYGYSTSDIANSNVVKDSSRTGVVKSNSGHAVYAYFSSSIYKRKETTAGTSVNLSFNGSNGTSSGTWDN
jgi:uncharacterized repeat protein (TIGR02543 family)